MIGLNIGNQELFSCHYDTYEELIDNLKSIMRNYPEEFIISHSITQAENKGYYLTYFYVRIDG